MRVEHPTYYQEAVGAAYPFDDAASRYNGTVRIDNDVLVDARIYVPDGPADVFISRVEVSDQVTIRIASSRRELASGSFGRNQPPDYVTLTDVDDVFVGVLQGFPGEGVHPDAGAVTTTSRGFAKLCGWPDGSHDFRSEQTRFAATVVTPQPQRGVRSVRTADGDLFFDDVILVGERGVQLSVESDAIRVDIVGDPLFVRRRCAAEGVSLEAGNALRGIVLNDETIFPSLYGGLTMVVGGGDESALRPGLRIKAIDGGLEIGFVG